MFKNLFTNLPYGITPQQAKIGLAIVVLGLLYYWVVMRPSLPWAYYVLGKESHDGMDADYVRAWAKAHQDNALTFTYNGKTYLTETGKVKV